MQGWDLMQDGYTQVGAGASDKRMAGQDLQHNMQTRTADEAPSPHRIRTQPPGSGGPMKAQIMEEMARHIESKQVRTKHLKDHYER